MTNQRERIDSEIHVLLLTEDDNWIKKLQDFVLKEIAKAKVETAERIYKVITPDKISSFDNIITECDEIISEAGEVKE